MENKKDFAEKIKTVNVDRRHFLKYAAAVTAAATLGPAFLAGCGKAGGTAGAGAVTAAAGGTAGIVVKKGEPMLAMFTTMTNDYFKMWSAGSEQAVQALGMKYEALMSEGKPETQISQMETKTSQGVKIFFVVAPDASNIASLANLATQNQAFWTQTWNMTDWSTPIEFGDYYVTFFTPSSIKAGYEMAKVLFEAMGGKGNFVQISGWPGSTPDWQRTAGMQLALKEYPNIKLLATQPGKWNRIDSRKVMENFIVAYPKIDGIFAQNDDEGIGAMNAAEERGLKIPVIGLDGNKETMDLIKQGRFTSSYTSFPFHQAGYSAVVAFDAANGWKPSVPERQMHTGGMAIDKTNVDAYYSKFTGDKIPMDWQLMSKILHPNDWDAQNELWPIDYDAMWKGIPQPNGFKYPEEIKTAKDKGEFERITKLYADHYKKKIM